MPKKQQHFRVKAREYGEQQLEALGMPPRMEFELDDGSTVELQHPWLWDDNIQAAHDAALRDRDSEEPENARVARAVLGADEHVRFLAGGGKSNQIVLALELMKRPQAIGDGDPKAR